MENIKNLIDSLDVKTWGWKILCCAIILFVCWQIINRVCKLVPVFFKKTCSDMGMASFLESVLKFLLRLLLVVSLLGYLGFNTTSIIAAISASLVAIGISLKDSVSNLVSGIILVVNKPIHVGDYIECDGKGGDVVKIEMLFTTLQTEDPNKTVIVPNAKLISNNITRISKFNSAKLELTYEISFECKNSDCQKFFGKEFIMNDKILQLPTPQINLIKLPNDKFAIAVELWCQNQYSEQVKRDLEKMFKKFENKFSK